MHFCFLSAEWLFNFWRFHLGKGTQMAAELIRDAYWIVQIPVSNLLYIRQVIQFWDSWFLQPATETKQSRLPPNLDLKILEIVTIPMKCSHASSVWKHQKHWRTIIALYHILYSNIQSSINDWKSQNWDFQWDFAKELPRCEGISRPRTRWPCWQKGPTWQDPWWVHGWIKEGDFLTLFVNFQNWNSTGFFLDEF